MKSLTFVLLFIFINSGIAKNSNSGNNNNSGNTNNSGKKTITHYKQTMSITPSIVPDYKVNIGDKAIFEGEICVLKKHPHKDKANCQAPELGTKFSEYEVRFYFPDTNTDVTEKVTLVKTDDSYQYKFESNEVQKIDQNRLTIIVQKNTDPSIYLNIEAKFQRHIDLLTEELINEVDIKKKEHITKLISTLTKVMGKVSDELFNNPSIYAKLDYPVQIENSIAPPVEYFSNVSGLKLWMKLVNGIAIDGERTKIFAKVSNINEPDFVSEYDDKEYKDNQWRYRAEYYFGGENLFTTDEIHIKENVMFEYEFDSPVLNVGELNKFEIKVFRSKEVPKHAASYNMLQNQGWGNISYLLEIQSDLKEPEWTNDSLVEGSYLQNLNRVSLNVKDDFGRVVKESIVGNLTGTLVSSDNINQNLNLDIISVGDEMTGLNIGSTSYNVDILFDTLAEGDYEISIDAQDFSKLSATPSPLNISFHIDRTKPLVTIDQQSNQLTNNPSFIINYEVDDRSPVNVKLIHNGIDYTPEVSYTGQFSVNLAEGQNNFELHVVDAAGNIADVVNVNNIELDTIPPEISNLTPTQNETIYSLNYKIKANSNEPLRKVSINELDINVSEGAESILYNAFAPSEGRHSFTLIAEDMAGNQTEVIRDYEVLLKLIRIELVSLEPKNGKIYIVGHEGAARSGITVNINGGFFNSTFVEVSSNGAFSAPLAYSSSFSLSASDPARDMYENYQLNFQADTTFTGIVKDVDGTPIPNVKVTLQASGVNTYTDENGVFAMNNPPTGDQKVLIDARTVEENFTQGKKKYSYTWVNVSLGNLERNVLEKTIFLAPLLTDGSETEIPPTEEIVVESIHAPGVKLEIKSGTARFPSGLPNKINIMEIPSDRTSIELLDFSTPDYVYALEPSGLTFTEPVKVTLPNPNGFPVGMEMVIMSKNSSTGYWEPDGTATVVSNSEIETKPGEGISHFSEIYATPYGIKIDPYAPEHKPGIYNDEGALTKSITLPSYKMMGKDVAFSLNYNSFWANPNTLVTNTFNTPTHHVYKDVSQSAGGFGTKVKVDGYVEVWQKPDMLKSQFTSGSVQTPWLFFDVSNPPEKSTVSYNVDMSELETGVYPAVATYVLQFRYIKVQRIRIRKERIFGGTFTKHLNEDINELMDAIFPPPLQTNLFVQNRKNSDVGSGWKLGLSEKIHNVAGNKVVVEEVSGKLTPYVMKSTIENIYTSNENIYHLTFDYNQDLYIFKDNDQAGTVIDGNFQFEGSLPPEPITIGINKAYKAKNWYNGIKDSRLNWACHYSKYSGLSQVKPNAAIVAGSTIFTVDSNHRFSLFQNFNKISKIGIYNSSQSFLFGEEGEHHYQTYPDNYTRYQHGHVFNNSDDYYCSQYSYKGCTSQLEYYARWERTHWDWYGPTAGCSAAYRKQGNVPTSGFGVGTSSQSALNDPRSIIEFNPSQLLIADRGNNSIRLINKSNSSTSVWAGTRGTGDNLSGNKSQISIYHPSALVKDDFGNVYVASERGYIRKIDPNGNVSHVAGSPSGKFQGTSPAKDAFFRDPQGLAIDSDKGLLYVADTGNHRIVQVDLINGIARSIAGTNVCVANDIGSGKASLNVSICNPKDILIDNDGNLVYLDSKNKMIRKLNIDFSIEGHQRYIPMNSNDNSELIRLSDGSFERNFRNGSTNTYDSEGFHLQSFDKLGNQTLFEYSNDLVTKITDPVGSITRITYLAGKVDTITDPANRVTRFNYNGEVLESVDFSDGSMESFTYDEKNMMRTHKNKKNYIAEYFYNEADKLTKVVMPDQSEVVFSDGLKGTYTADNYDENSKIEVADGSDPEIEDVYKDANGVETFLTKDQMGVVTQITDSKERVTTIERDLDGRPIKITRFDETFTQFEYNAYGDLIYKFDSETGEEENFEYSSLGSLTKYTDPRNKIKQNFFSNGLLIQSKDYNGNSIYKTYFSDGLLKTVKNDQNEETQFFYDEFGNLITKVSPHGEQTEYIRDAAGNIVEKINDKGISTLYSYDDFNRLTSVTTGVTANDPVGKYTEYNYTLSGQLASIIDPKSNTTTFEYDLMDRLAKKVTPLGQVTELNYDGNGNVVREKDPNGAIKTFEYDSDNLLIKKILPDSVYEMVYDDHGNMTLISDSDSAVAFSYEKIGKDYFVTSTTTEGDDLPTSTLSYTYDLVGNRILMSTPLGNFNYTYDNGNRLTNIKNHKNENFGFSYDAFNRLTGISRQGSVSELYFDKNSFLTDLIHKKGSTSINHLTYTRDGIGNRTSVLSSRGIASYTYDSESQLKSVTNSEVAGDYAAESFNYDDLGNRLNDQLGSSSYDARSQRLTEDYKHIYFYDLNGNMTSIQEKGMTGKVKNLTYSTENQLVKIEEFVNSILVKTVDYRYDALGRRTVKNVTDHGNAVNSFVRKYVYDGQEILAELDKDNNDLAVYTHSTLRTDDVLSVDVKDTKLASSTGSYFYLKDALGSVIDVVDSSGSIVQHYAYSAFGKILSIKDGNGNDVTDAPHVKTSYGFTNREHDSESGMMYYRARFYSPDIGRFISEDPHPGRLEFPRTHSSKYIYTLNNPLKYRDPSGEFFDPITLAIVGAVIGGINGILENQRNGGNWFEDVVGGALEGAAIGFALGTLGGWGTAGNIAAWTVSVKSVLQAAVTRRGGFVDNLGTYGGRNLASTIPLTYSGNKIKAKFGFKDNGLGLFDFAGWLYDFENVYDTACDDNGTQKDQQVCEQRPELIYIEI